MADNKNAKTQNSSSCKLSMNATLKSFTYTPAEIKAHLDKYIIGQEDAKRTLSVAVYNHYRRLQLTALGKSPKLELSKGNCILLGPTGTGKTAMIKAIANQVSVPCYIQDCTKITASGYVGSDVEDCLAGLLRICNYDLEKAQMGIVVLDEIDKIRKAEAGTSITRDVSGECVQQSLLKIIEGDVVGVPPMGGRKHPEQSLIYVNTSNILFIACGAFVGMEEIIKRRIRCSNNIGFGNSGSYNNEHASFNILDKVTSEDLQHYGMIPEWIGRFPIITNTESLTHEQMLRILTEPEDSVLKQYKELLSMDNIDLEFTQAALDLIVELAEKMKSGARGLRGIIERCLRDIMFEAPSLRKKMIRKNTLTVTDDTVRKNTQRLLD